MLQQVAESALQVACLPGSGNDQIALVANSVTKSASFSKTRLGDNFEHFSKIQACYHLPYHLFLVFFNKTNYIITSLPLALEKTTLWHPGKRFNTILQISPQIPARFHEL